MDELTKLWAVTLAQQFRAMFGENDATFDIVLAGIFKSTYTLEQILDELE